MYTRKQEKALGLTHRETVGREWVSAREVIVSDGLDGSPYPKKLRNYMGVFSQRELASMMEEEYSVGGSE